MKINLTDRVLFYTLKKGDVFLETESRNLYMVIDEFITANGNTFNVVDLADGELAHFDDDEPVIFKEEAMITA